MGSLVGRHHLGMVTGADDLYVLSKPGEPTTALAPDVAFVRAGRYPTVGSSACERPWGSRPIWRSRSSRCISTGPRWPRYKSADVWRPGDERPSSTVGIGGELDSEDVLPGFRYPGARLFSP